MVHVAILANLKKNAPKRPGQPKDAWADLDSEHTIDALADTLRQAGHRATFIEANAELPDRLREVRPDICFNIAEGHHGDSREAQVPALLELLRIPYTGSRVLASAISLNKTVTKRLWQSFGLRTAPFQEFSRPDEPLDPALRFPLFVKPAREGTGIGVAASSVVRDERELRAQVDHVLRTYQQPALVERFLAGRELTVGIIGNPPNQFVFPPVEVSINGDGGIYGFYAKSENVDAFSWSMPTLEPAFLAEIQKLALDAHNAIGALDVSRVDLRCDEDDVPHLLEINTLPGMTPGFSDLPIAADAIHLGYPWLVTTVLNLACQRFGLEAPAPVIPTSTVLQTAKVI